MKVTLKIKRYNPETLEVQWEGRTIADVLDLSVTRAREVFAEDTYRLDWLTQGLGKVPPVFPT